MGTAEKFCLRWNDFDSNVSQAFRELREEKDFFDVTLACEDNQVSAHKVILSACSPFFRSVLRRNPHQHPLLYLKGVKYQEMLAVLNFMYMGEVNVAQEELNSFLAVAEDLRVKGLTQGTGEGSSKPKKPEGNIDRQREPPRDPVPPPKRQKVEQRPRREEEDILEVASVKAEPRDQELSRSYQDPRSRREEEGAASWQQEAALVAEEHYQEEGYEEYEQDYGNGYTEEMSFVPAVPTAGMEAPSAGNYVTHQARFLIEENCGILIHLIISVYCKREGVAISSAFCTLLGHKADHLKKKKLK